MTEDVVNLIKLLGVGCRTPNDELFRVGNEINKVHKIFGIREVDDEEFYHKSYSVSCHIPGCSLICDAIYEYDQHYNSCHRFSCSQCSKYLPSSHLLDLHLMETHDAYFATSSEKKPMFQCYLQECDKVFKTPQQRREHCISDHKFPSNFRFDEVKRTKKPKKKEKTKEGKDVDIIVGAEENMEIEETEEMKNMEKKSNSKPVKNIKRGRVRKPVLDLDCFVKDLKESLPT